jgi:MGT family glycosyltransferase
MRTSVRGRYAGDAANGHRGVSVRVLICAWPFEGHVHPLISIALAVRERGGSAAFLTGERMRAVIAAEGFPVFAFERVPPAWEPVQALEARTRGRLRPLRAQQRAFRHWLVETIPDQVADVDRAVASCHPDVILADFSMWGVPLVVAKTGTVPVAVWCTLMGPQIPGPAAPPAWGMGLRPARGLAGTVGAFALRGATDVLARGLRRRVDELRRRHGLPPLGSSVNEAVGRVPRYLVGNLPELDYGRGDLPSSVRYVGPCLWHPPAKGGVERWLDAIPARRAWVHVTEGTSHYQHAFVLEAAAKGLAGEPVEAILTTGKEDRDPERLGIGPLAPNVHITRWLRHDHLLPRCAAVVTTGGASTVMGALTAGVPLVVVPTTWDKPDNARRVVDAEVGVRLSVRRCTPDNLRAAVREVLADPRYGTNARRIAERLAAAPGPDGAAALLEQLVPAQVPMA